MKKAKVRNERVRKEVKGFILRYLSTHPCVDCGEKDPIVLEFDHLKDKSFLISTIGRDKTIDIVQSEIAKCEVRCANCHRRRTAKQAGWYKDLPL